MVMPVGGEAADLAATFRKAASFMSTDHKADFSPGSGCAKFRLIIEEIKLRVRSLYNLENPALALRLASIVEQIYKEYETLASGRVPLTGFQYPISFDHAEVGSCSRDT